MAQPGETVVEKTGDEGMVEALNNEIKGSEVTPEAGAKASEDVVKTPEKLEAERIAKEEEAKKLAEDPDFDLGLDEDGKTPLKFKRSQILEFKKGSMLQADYTKKTQELAAERANFKEVVDIIEYLKKNPSKAEKIVAILEAKEEAAKEQEFDLNKAMTDIDKLLADLPADDPYAQALRNQKGIIQQTIAMNQKLQARLDQLDQGRVSDAENKLNAEAEQTLREVIASKQKALSFSDQEEADYWKKLTLTCLVNNPKEYSEMDKAQFTDYFNKLADKVQAEIVKMGEKHVNKYIKSKGGPGGVPVVGGGAIPAAPGKEPITTDNLQGALERELQKESEKSVT